MQCIRCGPDWGGGPLRMRQHCRKAWQAGLCCNGPALLTRRSGSVAHTSCMQDTSVPWQGSPEEDILAAWRKRRQVRVSLCSMNLPPVCSPQRTGNGARQQELASACAWACATAWLEPDAHLINPQHPASSGKASPCLFQPLPGRPSSAQQAAGLLCTSADWSDGQASAVV